LARHLKSSKTRLIIQAAFTALTNGYYIGFAQGKVFRGGTKVLCVPGLNCYSCPGALGSCPIGSLQAVIDSGSFKVACYVMGVLMITGTIFGRAVCGFLCPFGLVQDLLYKIPFPNKKKNIPGHKGLKYLKYLVLLVFVILLPMLAVDQFGAGEPWFCKWICPSGTLMAGIPLMIANPGLRAAAGFLFSWKMILLTVVVVLSMKYYRPFCKYLCPLGAIYGGFNPIAFYRLHVDEDKCIKCGACQKACGMDLKIYETPNSMECIRCGDCMRACPKEAVYSSLGMMLSKGKENEV